MSTTTPLSRPASLPDVRLSLDYSEQSCLITILEPLTVPGGASGESLPPGGPAQDKSLRRKCSQNSSRKLGNSPVSQIKGLPGAYEPVSYDKIIIVASVDECSINDLNIFDVHRSLIKRLCP